jgi:dipeptidyl aminopeptidase/acylaminoacyl peptidase
MSEDHLVRESFTLHNSSGEVIHGDLRFDATKIDLPTVIVCHSFMAFKNWGFFPYVGEKFAEAGVASIVFNFSRNGVVGDEKRITDFGSFERNTFSQELEDIETVIYGICQGQIGAGIIDPDRITLVGHSRGGGIAIVQTSADPRVRSLVTWSAISTFERWTDHQKNRWRAHGFLSLAKDTTASPLRVGRDLLLDIETQRERLDITEAAGKIRVPWLILHGTVDVTVHAKEAETLYEASNKTTTELKLLEHVGHLYNAASRSEDQYHTLHHVLDLTIQWIHHHL